MGATTTTKTGGFVALKPMVERFGVEVTGRCRICGTEGRTEMHHIISASRIAEMDRAGLRRLAGGDTTFQIFDSIAFDDDELLPHEAPRCWRGTIDELRQRMLHRLPGNIIELCIPCFRDTEWSAIVTYKRWKKELEEGD